MRRYGIGALCILLLIGTVWWLLDARDASWQRIEQAESFTFQPDGQAVVAVIEHNIATFAWPSLRERRAFAAFQGSGTVTLSGDGKWAAIYTVDQQCVEIWDIELALRTTCVPRMAARIEQIFLSRDGTVLLTKQAQDLGGVRLWQLQDGEVIAELPTQTAIEGFIALSPSGRLLAYASDHTIEIVRVQDTIVIQSLVLPQLGGAGAITFSDDGQLLTAAVRSPKVSGYQDIWVWNLADGQLINTLEGYRDIVRSIAFSPNMDYIAAGGGDTELGTLNDASIKIWRRSDNQLLHTFHGPSFVGQVVFSPDGKAVGASTYRGGTVYFWQLQ